MVCILFGSLGLGASALGQGLAVGFSQPSFEARVGEATFIRVELSSTLPVGLFSYGVRLVFDPAEVLRVTPAGVNVPAELDFNGVRGPGALRQVGPGFAAVKGTVDFAADPVRYYSGVVLATFAVTPLRMEDCALSLELFRTLGPDEQVFVGGDGTKLDDTLRFGSARLWVVPEPSAAVLWLAGLTLVCVRRAREGGRGGLP